MTRSISTWARCSEGERRDDASRGRHPAAPGVRDADRRHVGGALANVRTFFDVDLCALLSVSDDLQTVNVRLGSFSEGIPPVGPEINLVELYPWGRDRLLFDRQPIRLGTRSELPAEAAIDHETWQLYGIRSALSVPIETGGTVGHLIAMQTIRKEVDWPEVFVGRLRLLGEMIVGALERKDMFDRLRGAEAGLQMAACAGSCPVGRLWSYLRAWLELSSNPGNRRRSPGKECSLWSW